MSDKTLSISFFASSLISAYWNGAATYYRGLARALHERGHRISFFEPDAYQRKEHRDLDSPEYADSVIFPAETEQDVYRALECAQAQGCDVLVKASGVGVFDELLETAVLDYRSNGSAVIFWDVDAPATLQRVNSNPRDPFLELIPEYDLILTYGGGEPVARAYSALGARACIPVYNALDASTHFPVTPDQRFKASLSFLGNRLPDREERVWEFFFKPAQLLRQDSFTLGGSGWEKEVPELPNLIRYGHVYSKDHNAFYCSSRAVLNITRKSMVEFGYSPATRVFEVAGAGACLITDAWEGIEIFLQPGRECLVARNGNEVAEILASLEPERAHEIGQRALNRVLSEHTYSHRARQVEEILLNLFARTEGL